MNKYHESVNVLIPRPSYKGYHKGLTENYSRAQTFLFSEKNFVIWLKKIQIRRESSWQEKLKFRTPPRPSRSDIHVRRAIFSEAFERNCGFIQESLWYDNL